MKYEFMNKGSRLVLDYPELFDHNSLKMFFDFYKASDSQKHSLHVRLSTLFWLWNINSSLSLVHCSSQFDGNHDTKRGSSGFTIFVAECVVVYDFCCLVILSQVNYPFGLWASRNNPLTLGRRLSLICILMDICHFNNQRVTCKKKD